MIITLDVIQLFYIQRKYSVTYSQCFSLNIYPHWMENPNISLLLLLHSGSFRICNLSAFSNCKSCHLILNNWTVKSVFFISIQETLWWRWFVQQWFQMRYWGSLVRSCQGELLLLKSLIQYPLHSPKVYLFKKLKMCSGGPEAWGFPAEGQVPVLSLITQLS